MFGRSWYFNTPKGSLPSPSGPVSTTPTVRRTLGVRPSETPWARLIRNYSDRLVAAQRPLRILEAIRWDEDVQAAFFADGGRKLPPVTPDYYTHRRLPFDPHHASEAFRELERDVHGHLGRTHPAARLLTRACRESRQVVALLQNRGTRFFASLSSSLYCPGTGAGASDQLANVLAANPITGERPESPLDTTEVVKLLRIRLAAYFGVGAVHVRVVSGLTADAAAGGTTLKVRRGARLRPRDVRVLEVHEGWVHLGTTLNGRAQPFCTFLGHGLPSATRTQEGLAVLTELLSHASYPDRVRRLLHRAQAVTMASAGANFLDIYRFFLAQGYLPPDAYQQSVRIFRGSLPEGCGPFAKDRCYVEGCLQLAALLDPAGPADGPSRIRCLFCGKTRLGDTADLAALSAEGLLAPPRFLPAVFMSPQPLRAPASILRFAADLSR